MFTFKKIGFASESPESVRRCFGIKVFPEIKIPSGHLAKRHEVSYFKRRRVLRRLVVYQGKKSESDPAWVPCVVPMDTQTLSGQGILSEGTLCF